MRFNNKLYIYIYMYILKNNVFIDCNVFKFKYFAKHKPIIQPKIIVKFIIKNGQFSQAMYHVGESDTW